MSYNNISVIPYCVDDKGNISIMLSQKINGDKINWSIFSNSVNKKKLSETYTLQALFNNKFQKYLNNVINIVLKPLNNVYNSTEFTNLFLENKNRKYIKTFVNIAIFEKLVELFMNNNSNTNLSNVIQSWLIINTNTIRHIINCNNDSIFKCILNNTTKLESNILFEQLKEYYLIKYTKYATEFLENFFNTIEILILYTTNERLVINNLLLSVRNKKIDGMNEIIESFDPVILNTNFLNFIKKSIIKNELKNHTMNSLQLDNMTSKKEIGTGPNKYYLIHYPYVSLKQSIKDFRKKYYTLSGGVQAGGVTQNYSKSIIKDISLFYLKDINESYNKADKHAKNVLKLIPDEIKDYDMYVINSH
jgi:hypothetical protein